jgi:hypothetical protein
MKVNGSAAPPAVNYELIDKGKTAYITFTTNVQAISATEWEYDEYVLTRPHTTALRATIEANVSLWLNFARDAEIEEKSKEARAIRDGLIAETDWTQTLDAPVSPPSLIAIRAYRQALRDITETASWPYIEDWPERPDIVAGTPDPVDEAFDSLTGGDSNA